MSNESFVCVDLGASGTRVTSNSGIVYDIPNNVIFVDAGERIELALKRDEADLHNDIVNALDVTITKKAGGACEHFPCRVLMGDLADRYPSTPTRPSLLKGKADQRINYVSAIVAAAHQRLVELKDDNINRMYVALPPTQLIYSKDNMTSQLVGTYHVKFNKLDKEVSVSIGDAMCLEEAYMALVTFFFNKNGTPRKNAETYAKLKVMSLDIGASTTDIAVASDRRYVEKSGQTFQTGCNVIQANIANAIRGRFGYDPTPEELDMVLCTGRAQRGSKYVEMGDVVRHAKVEFSKSIIEQIQSYFRTINMPLQTIAAIAVSGGGSLESGYKDANGKYVKTCSAVSEFITTELNQIVEEVDVVNVNQDSDGTIDESINPREANITGMYIRAMIDVLKARA